MNRYLRVLGFGVAVASISLPFATASYAAPGSNTPAPPVAGILAQGQLTNGSTPLSGASVIALALPSGDAMAAAPDGAALQLTQLGASTTDAHGNFSVPAAFGSIPAGFVSSSGAVNIQLLAVSGSQVLDTFYSADATPAGSLQSAPASAPALSPRALAIAPRGRARVWRELGSSSKGTPTFHFNFARHTATGRAARAVSHGETKAAPGLQVARAKMTPALRGMVAALHARSEAPRADRVAAATTLMPESGGVSPCEAIAGTWYTDIQEHFLTVNTQSGIPAEVDESADSSDTLGVEVATTGTDAFKESGTGTISRDASTAAHESTQTSQEVYNRVNYRHYALTCGSQESREPVSFYDILTDRGTDVNEASFTNCATHAKGSTWSTGSASNATWGAGLDLLGVSLSAQSGYSTSVNISYTFSAGQGEVCGNSSLGPAQSSRVEADLF